MDILSSHIDISSSEYALNKESNLTILNELRTRIEKTVQGGGEKNVKKHQL